MKLAVETSESGFEAAISAPPETEARPSEMKYLVTSVSEWPGFSFGMKLKYCSDELFDVGRRRGEQSQEAAR